MPATWKAYSKEIIGYVAPQTSANEEYVATLKVQKWVDQGKDVVQIGLLWNQGHTGKCSSGVNKHGVKYDSCAYVKKIHKHYALIN